MTAPDAFPYLPAPSGPPQPDTRLRTLLVETGLVLALAAAGALLGLLMGAMWHWLAPRVPMHADSSAVYLNDPEGEQAIGADGTFALLGAGFGAFSGTVAYLATRARRGGIGTAIGLAAGGLLGSLIAWGGGQSAKAYEAAVLKLAKTVPAGQTFHGPLQLTTRAVLTIWPLLALLVLLALTGLFTPRPPAEPLGPLTWGAPATPEDAAPQPSDQPESR